jgi:hypothetical protein
MSFSSDIPLQSNQLSVSVEFPKPDDSAFLDTLSLTYKRIADAVNTKEGALYQPVETATFQKYFKPAETQNFRNVYRMTINFGTLPNTTSDTEPHNIDFTENFRVTRIYGAATDPVNLLYIPLPYASASGADIELSLDATNVIITTASNRTAFTESTVVIEYTKSP